MDQYSLLSIVCTASALAFSIWLFKRNKVAPAVCCLMFANLVLKINLMCFFFLHDWDEKYHALVAKHFMADPLKPTLYLNPVLPYDYTNWMGNHIWLHKPPLALWICCIGLRIFGINVIGLRLPSVLLSTFSIYLTYRIGRELFDPKTGYMAAWFHSVFTYGIAIATGKYELDHVDTVFIFFIELGVYFAVINRSKNQWKWDSLTGLCAGLALLTKWLPGLIIFPVWYGLTMDRPLKVRLISFVLMFSVCMSVFLPWQFYIFHAFPKEAAYEMSLNTKHFSQVVENHGGSIFFYFLKMPEWYGGLIYIPVIWFLARSWRTKQGSQYWAIALWFLIPYFFFSIAKTKMDGFVLICAPALFIMESHFWVSLKDQKPFSRHRWYLAIFLILFPLFTVGDLAGYLRLRLVEKRIDPWVEEFKRLNQEEKQSNVVVFNVADPIECMFFTDLTAYGEIPSLWEVNQLKDRGYHLAIYEKRKLPRYLLEDRSILVLPAVSD